MGALDELLKVPYEKATSLQKALLVLFEDEVGYETLAGEAVAELAALTERVAVSEKIMQDTKNYLDAVIQSQGGVGMEYELGMVEDIQIYFDKLQEAQ